MVDYERGLGDLGFTGTKERGLGRRLGQGESPKSAARAKPRAAAAALGPAARVRVLVGQGVGLEGHPCPSLYRWEGAGQGRRVLPQLGLQGQRVEGEELLPK